MLEPELHAASRPDGTATPVEVIARPAANISSPDAAAAVESIARAGTTHGAFYLAAHGAESRVETLFDLTREFFALPVDERDAVAATGAQECGYHGRDRAAQVFAATRVGPALRPVFGTEKWPARPAGLETAVEDYRRAMYAIAQDVLSLVARGLGLPATYFEQYFGPDSVQNLQLRYYDAHPPINPMPLGAHTDPPPLILIAQDDTGGLESRCDEHWLALPPLPGTLVCQFGGVMEQWTQGRYRANVHRVRTRENAPRHSIVYNLLPRPDASLEPVPTCRRADAPARSAMITAGEFLRASLGDAVGYAPDRSPLPASPRAELDESALAQCRAAMRRDSGGGCSLDRAERSENGLRLDLVTAQGTRVVLDLAQVEPGRRYYRTHKGIGISYRGELRDPRVLGTIDRVLAGVVASLGPALRPTPGG